MTARRLLKTPAKFAYFPLSQRARWEIGLERETGLEPATSSLGSWHSTTELLPHCCVFRYLTVRQGFSRFRRLSIPSRKSIQTMGSDRKMDSKTDSKRRAETGAHPA